MLCQQPPPLPFLAALVGGFNVAPAHLDDPYSMAVFVRFLQREFDVVRVKNRFGHDTVEKVTVERLQAEFYAADVSQEDAESSASSGSGLDRYQRNYRDVMLNLVMKG